MTKFQYWEPEKGLEEIQANIYNTNNPEQQPATAKQIRERFEGEKNFDPKTVRYAFSDDGKPLAYIQARDYDQVKETHLGYPWALDGCPADVQHRLFDETLEYLKQREIAKKYAIRMNAGIEQKNVLSFFKEKGLQEVSKNYRYNVDLTKLSEQVNDTRFTVRKGTKEDIGLLVDLIKADGRYSDQLSSDAEIEKYFSERVIPADHAILVFDGETLVQATAPLLFTQPGDDEERLILRFHGRRPETAPSAWKPLLIGVAQECLETNYGTDKPLSVYHGSTDPSEELDFTLSLSPAKEVTGYSFGV
ncbi:MAG: hypothetical protein ACFFE8_02025 [Candidatus Heimdallarchaeota archaeon]